MTKCSPIPTYLVVLFVISSLMSIIGKPSPWTHLLPQELLSLDLATRLSLDSNAINLASTDFGKIIRTIPAAVLYPSSHEDISNLIKFSSTCSRPFSIAARGRGHSVRGQAMAHNGVVIDMRSLNCGTNGSRIKVGRTNSTNFYVDVGGEQLWIDVLNATLEHGLAPRSWTDYLYLTVGGTLSNAGISGQAFRYGPQISNVYEMDVITGRGETVTCSKQTNSELFFAVLGGLGQFGIITRARIALDPAPQRVRWVRMVYDDFSAFTRDQEHLIFINNGDHQLENIKGLLDYVEGSVMMDQISSRANNWRSSFFSSSDQPKITSLATKQGDNNIIYYLEVAKYYDHLTIDTIDEEMDLLLNGLSYIPGFMFTKDVSYVDFLNRVRIGELKLQAQGLWDVPHPWLNLFVPKSQISEFNSGVFHGILKNTKTAGPLLLYPTNRNK
ncbi:FAD linked oxidase [Macleaya cordata]|uniref:cytokinin dehydrogenase n=1 Tax=Macleaya cordata TaxID=56857 RepID=A0A200QCE8_MACCD|nr:FAD linked oxidase [Macleaya cordata]